MLRVRGRARVLAGGCGVSSTHPTTPVARIEHTCDVCSGPIRVGTRYQRWRYFGDGADAPSTVKVHPDCYRLLGDVGGFDDFGEWDADSMGEAIRWSGYDEESMRGLLDGVAPDVTATWWTTWRKVREQ